jgi:hypothetical protein
VKVDLLTERELEKLIDWRQAPCVSIFSPTHRAGPKTRQDPIRLKNLLGEARERLVGRGLRTAEADEVLEPANALLEDGVFWRYQSDGIALFLSPGESRYYRVPLALEELVVVADRFHVKPLLPLLTGDGEFYVLALSQSGVRLFRATRHSIGEVRLRDVPESLADALRRDDAEKQLQFHTGTSGGGRGGRPAIFHGHASEEEPREDILRYFRQIDRGVEDPLKGQRAPLVLAGVDYLLPIYREVSAYPHLEEKGITGNPEGVGEQELRERAWTIVAPRFREAQREAAARYRRLAGTGQTSTDPSEVVPEACFGRVDVLFVALGSRLWGAFDPDTAEVTMHEEAESGDGDLLDLAAVHTLLNRGTVYALDSKEMPQGATVAALYRY